MSAEPLYEFEPEIFKSETQERNELELKIDEIIAGQNEYNENWKIWQ